LKLLGEVRWHLLDHDYQISKYMKYLNIVKQGCFVGWMYVDIVNISLYAIVFCLLLSLRTEQYRYIAKYSLNIAVDTDS